MSSFYGGVFYFLIVAGVFVPVERAISLPAFGSAAAATPIEMQLRSRYGYGHSHGDSCFSEGMLDEKEVARFSQMNPPAERFPGYWCSGLIIRGVRANLPSGMNAWDPYPENRTLDTSFTFIRGDITVARLAWDYVVGFIILPPKELGVNCFFPVDAESDKRADKGCGPHEKHPEADPACKVIYGGAGVSIHGRNADAALRCRFDLKDKKNAARNFSEGLVMVRETSRGSDIPNDLKIETWKKGYDARLPVLAFFFINDTGKPLALRARDKYEELSGKRLPVVRMTFPASGAGGITFKQEG